MITDKIIDEKMTENKEHQAKSRGKRFPFLGSALVGASFFLASYLGTSAWQTNNKVETNLTEPVKQAINLESSLREDLFNSRYLANGRGTLTVRPQQALSEVQNLVALMESPSGIDNKTVGETKAEYEKLGSEFNLLRGMAGFLTVGALHILFSAIAGYTFDEW